MKIKLDVKQYPKEGYLQHTYSPLRNVLFEQGEIGGFNVDADKLNISLNPLFITCQPSYDGTVNLIMNDDVNPPRLINTRFTKKENDTFKIINRNQVNQSNLYDINKLDSHTRLIKNVESFPIIDLLSVNNAGSLKGGNYTFYIRYIDGDFNESPVVSESGQVSVFHGNNPSDISGTLSDELTTKSIKLRISNLDTSYNAFMLYYVRTYCGINGAKMKEAKMLTEKYSFSTDTLELELIGYEPTVDYTIDELNIRYLSINSAKTQAQVQNMLFFGNLSKDISLEAELQNLAYYIEVRLKQDSGVGYVDTNYTYQKDTEYYNPTNIYYKLGYWPDEYYKLGVVFIMNDDSTTPVFSLRGCSFRSLYDGSGEGTNLISNKDETKNAVVYSEDNKPLVRNSWLTTDAHKINTFGVFKNPKDDDNPIIDPTSREVRPFYYETCISKEVQDALKKRNVKGYFFVRQTRVPTIFGQGVSFGIDPNGYAPLIYKDGSYLIESFLTEGDYNDDDYEDENEKTANKFKKHPMLKSNSDFENSLFKSDDTFLSQSSCLISVDVDTSPTLQSILNGSEFVIEGFKAGEIDSKDRLFKHTHLTKNSSKDPVTFTSVYKPRAIYVSEGTPYKFIENYGFSTQFGSAEDVKGISFVGKIPTNTRVDELGDGSEAKYTIENVWDSDSIYGGNYRGIIRGIYTGVVGLDKSLVDGNIYNIRIPGYEPLKEFDYFEIRKNDNSEYYAISNRIILSDSESTIPIYRGDCFTNTVTVRLLRNFVDSDAPITDTIVDKYTWGKNYAGFMQMGTEQEDGKKPTASWSKMNKSDINNVPLGMWFTYKCLSSNNLGLRSVDHNYPDEEALMGTARTFYPLSGINVKSAHKVANSNLLNPGYSTTVGNLVNIPAKDLPYQKELFDNRIAFSNIQVEDEFQNGYRVFQNLAYKDIDRQYGSIVKLLPWGTDLLCVFEHGIGIVPVNQKALIQTTTGQSVHMYGAGVLQSQITLITGDYGSVWQESIVQTPIGVYGVDTFSKKIWRYSHHKGFETISDMVIQRFLNDNILFDEHTSSPMVGIRDVKAHYNNYKGDVMFTFYNSAKNCEWNLCYNERLGKWSTRYSWVPINSENINNIFYSFDKKKTEVLSKVNNILDDKYGLKLSKDTLPYYGAENVTFSFELSNIELDKYSFLITPKQARTSYLDKTNEEIKLEIPVEIFKFEPSDDGKCEMKIDLYQFQTWWKSMFEKEIHTPTAIKKMVEIINDDGDYEEVFSYTQNVTEFPALDEDGNFMYFEDGSQMYHEIEIEDVVTYEYDAPLDFLPLWLEIDVNVSIAYDVNGEDVPSANRSHTICLLIHPDTFVHHEDAKKMYLDMFTNGVYVHGRAGIFDEIDYTDDRLDNQITPTKWYDRQEPFEFEFVINNPIGLHKVFETLTIVSNNVAPESIQFEIEGDAYSMWKLNGMYDKNKKKEQYLNNLLFKNASLKWDTILNQYSILMTQECKSIEKFGRRFGNMHYKEDAWYITIDPLLLNKNGKTTSTKLRDKYLKVRVRYSGEDLAVITAIKSIVNLSAS